VTAAEAEQYARELFVLSRPRSADFHLVSGTPGGHQLFVVDRSQVFGIDTETASEIDALLSRSLRLGRSELLNSLGIRIPEVVGLDPPQDPKVRALSLAIAQKCNLGCVYCYAKGGSFDGPEKNMPVATAYRAVDLLLSQATPGERVNLAFLGGEPLSNREALHSATRYARERAAEAGIKLTFSITTNGTLISPADIDLFEEHGFAVTVSIDGLKEIHDRSRPYKSGRGSFDRIMSNVRPMLSRRGNMQVSARITVTPNNLALRATLDAFVEEGFHSVGFSPVLNGMRSEDEMDEDDLCAMLAQMIDCGREYEKRAASGSSYPFANLENALTEIHRGTHRPYPCGAGAGYFGVSADGDLSACHRFVGEPAGAMGSLHAGVDRDRQRRWLEQRNVQVQTPCGTCWARTLCGGGCHHEVIHRGRKACNFIRGWLHYCLSVYGRLYDRSQAARHRAEC
jgi:uncharacterized protein